MTKFWMGSLSATMMAAVLSGCSNTPVDIGEKDTQGEQTGTSALVGTWDGYVEAYTFEDGSDRVRLTVDSQGKGTIRFGNRELIPPPTDPKANYPAFTTNNYWILENPHRLWSGYEYALQNNLIDAERIRFDIGELQPFESYCALQTPVKVSSDVSSSDYACIGESIAWDGKCYVCPPDSGCSYDLTPDMEVPCEQQNACAGVRFCTCYASRCTAAASQGLPVDATLDDTHRNLTGTLIYDSQRLTIHLKRQ